MSRVPIDITVRDRLGNALPGIRLYVYERGTTTEVEGFTTEGGATPVTYPLLSNEEGHFPDAWYAPGQYDFYSPDDPHLPTTHWNAVEGGETAVVPIGVDETDGTLASQADLDAEEAARIAGDSAEATARSDADAALQGEINAAEADIATLQGDLASLDSDLTALDAAAVKDGDAAGGVLAGTYPDPSFAADMATQAELDANAAAHSVVPENEETANYTLALSDAGKQVTMNSGSATVVTVPANAAVAFPVGTQIVIGRAGAGAVSIAGDTGVTVRNAGSIAEQYGVATLWKRATDEWWLNGELE